MAAQAAAAAAGEVDPALRELAASGFCVLASQVPGLHPLKNEVVPQLMGLQQRYARVPSSPLTTAFNGPLVIAAPLADQHQVEVAVTFDVVQAPASFAMPVMQKRPWDPPFQVRMTWRAALPLQFSTRVAAFAVDEKAVTSMLSWQVPSSADAQKSLLEHQQERTVVLSPEAGNETGLHAAEAIFTFNRLSFGQPSSMRPRWLVFAASLLGGGCVYSHVLLPTVVMSRMTEQFDKAKRVLWGGAEPAGEAPIVKMDYRQMRKYVVRELERVGIQREPSEGDYRYLASRAGFVTGPDDEVRACSASSAELAAFKQWFASHLVMLKHIRTHYERSDPQVVSGFGMTREQADALLAPHPHGTFLLRFGSQGGQLVLSLRSALTGGSTAHYTLDTVTLQHNGLEVLLERHGKADTLLDPTTGLLHSRAEVLDRSYLQAVNAAEARKRLRRRDDEGEQGESPQPPPALVQGIKEEVHLGDEGGPVPALARSMSLSHTQGGGDAHAAVTRSLSMASQQCSQAAQHAAAQQQLQQVLAQQMPLHAQLAAQQAAAQQAQQAQQGQAAMQLDGQAGYWDTAALPRAPYPQAAYSPYHEQGVVLPMMPNSVSLPLALPSQSRPAAGGSPWAAAGVQHGSHTVGAPPLLPPSSGDGRLRWNSRGLSPPVPADANGLGGAAALEQQPWPPSGDLAAAAAAASSPTSSGTASFPGSTGTGSSGAGVRCVGPAGGLEPSADLLVAGLSLAPGRQPAAAAWPPASGFAAQGQGQGGAGQRLSPPVLSGILPELRLPTAGTALRQLALADPLGGSAEPGDIHDLLAKFGTGAEEDAGLHGFI